MQQLHEKIADMNSCYYDLRGKIVKAERRIAILTERGEMWEQYNQYIKNHGLVFRVSSAVDGGERDLAFWSFDKRESIGCGHVRKSCLFVHCC